MEIIRGCALEIFAMWDNQMLRRPQIDISFDLQPSLEYIQCPLPLQYNTPPGSYPPYYSTLTGSYPSQYSTHPCLSSSMAFVAYDFSSMFRTPLRVAEENVDHCDHPQHER
ncbi:hypothetical protein PVK06_011442 [Gossypium arboreum]|uniref:Uncharacterized protein n=1 Tax=Gossypium arboreum TaxID=29729 RepID=A0ABR0Q8Z1_GOSAR|nr:hypothetical protein PVK06_011442 [Gossypium arboreum]